MRDPFVRFQTDITTLCMTFYVTNVRSTSLFVIDKFGVVNKIRFMQGILDNSDIKTYINREEKNSNGVFIVNRYTIPQRSAIDLSNNLEHNPNLMLLKSEEITQRFREIVKNRSMIANDIVFSIVTFVPFDLIVNNNGNYYDPASQVTLTTSLDLKTENNTNRDRISSLSIELDLVDAVEKIDGVKTARILYLYPSTTTHNLIDKIADSKVFVNYFDMPLQHISQNMLKIMKRGKGAEKLIELMNYMRSKPNSFVRTTFIAGHPGESEDDFEELCSFVEEFGFDRGNVFSYSDEEGTSAETRDDKIEQELIDERAEILGDIISQTTIKSLENDIGKSFEVYIDGESEEHEYLLSARKTIWAPQIDGEIYINDNEDNIPIVFGEIYEVEATQLAGDKLLAKIIRKV